MAKKISVSTHKGGAGKTATALAVSAALANAGHRVLLIDLDPQGHCAAGLNIEVEEPSLKDFFERHPTVPLRDVIQRTALDNLDIAPSHLGLEWISAGLAGRPKREELLRRGLKEADQEYGFIIMDTPPSLNVLTQNGITAADFVLIPTGPDARVGEAIHDLQQLIKMLKGDAFDAYRILLVKMDGRKTKTNSVIRAAVEPYGEHVFKTEVPISEPINQAQMAGKDLYSYDASSTGAQAYNAVLDELLTLLRV